jgi:hypothetical protein
MTLHLLWKIKFKILNISRKDPLVLPIGVDCRHNVKIEVICHLSQRQNTYIATETKKFASYAESFFLTDQNDFLSKSPTLKSYNFGKQEGKRKLEIPGTIFHHRRREYRIV